MSDKPISRWNDDEGEGQTGLLTERKVRLKKPNMYRVILLNDDYTPRDFVVWLLRNVFHLNESEATQKMLEIHNTGAGVAGVFSHDVARTKVFQVRGLAERHDHPLECTMEVEEQD